MATSPLNREPSTKTGHKRSAAPRRYTITPTQRVVSPSKVQKPMRSAYGGTTALRSETRPKAMNTHRFWRSSFSPELRFALLKGTRTITPRVTAAKAINGGWLTNAVHPPNATIASPKYTTAEMRLRTNIFEGVVGFFIREASSALYPTLNFSRTTGPLPGLPPLGK